MSTTQVLTDQTSDGVSISVQHLGGPVWVAAMGVWGTSKLQVESKMHQSGTFWVPLGAKFADVDGSTAMVSEDAPIGEVRVRMSETGLGSPNISAWIQS